MAFFDIPTILAILRPGEDWGPCAQSNSTYAALAATWRGSQAVPTLAEMNAVSATLTELPNNILEMWRIKARLDALSLLNSTNATINGNHNTDPVMFHQWTEGGEFRRDSNFISKLATILNYTAQQMDQFFVDSLALS